MKFAPIIDPSVRRPSPKPVRVDLQTMCAAGTVIGVLMLVWEHFDRWDYRRLGE